MITLRSYHTPLHTTTLSGYQLKILDDARSSKSSLHIVPRQTGSTTIWWYYASLLYNNNIPFKILTANVNMKRDYIDRFNLDSIYGLERVPMDSPSAHIINIQSVRPGYIAHDTVVLLDTMDYSLNLGEIDMLIKNSLLKGNHIHMIYSHGQVLDNNNINFSDIFTY